MTKRGASPTSVARQRARTHGLLGGAPLLGRASTRGSLLGVGSAPPARRTDASWVGASAPEGRRRFKPTTRRAAAWWPVALATGTPRTTARSRRGARRRTRPPSRRRHRPSPARGGGRRTASSSTTTTISRGSSARRSPARRRTVWGGSTSRPRTRWGRGGTSAGGWCSGPGPARGSCAGSPLGPRRSSPVGPWASGGTSCWTGPRRFWCSPESPFGSSGTSSTGSSRFLCRMTSSSSTGSWSTHCSAASLRTGATWSTGVSPTSRPSGGCGGRRSFPVSSFSTHPARSLGRAGRHKKSLFAVRKLWDFWRCYVTYPSTSKRGRWSTTQFSRKKRTKVISSSTQVILDSSLEQRKLNVRERDHWCSVCSTHIYVPVHYAFGVRDRRCAN